MDYETALFVGGPRNGDRMVVIKGASRIENRAEVKPFVEGAAGGEASSYELAIYLRDEAKPEHDGGDIRFVLESLDRKPLLSNSYPTPI